MFDTMKAFLAVGVVVLALSQLNIPPAAEANDTNDFGQRPQIICEQTVSSRHGCMMFAEDSINLINTQIQMELNASHAYLAMSAYFARDNVYYPGFAKFFRDMSHEERDHAEMFIDYLTKRGGYYHIKQTHKPRTLSWESPLDAVREALELEKSVNDAILNLHWLAQGKFDPHLNDFLETVFLTEQVDSIHMLARWVTVLTRYENDNHAVQEFDSELLEGHKP